MEINKRQSTYVLDDADEAQRRSAVDDEILLAENEDFRDEYF